MFFFCARNVTSVSFIALLQIGPNEAVFNEVKLVMEVRSTAIFLRYVNLRHGERLFLEEYEREVRGRCEEFKAEALRKVME